jgi:hypothetical protein
LAAYCIVSHNFNSKLRPDVQVDVELKFLSESDLEASRSSKELHKLTNRILASNKDVSKRLRHLEDKYESESVYTVCHRNGSSDSESVFSVRGMMETSDVFQNIRQLGTVPELTAHQSFHLDLNTSRVYRRTLSYECDTSFTTSIVRTHAWSVFTGVSLSEISKSLLSLFHFQLGTSQTPSGTSNVLRTLVTLHRNRTRRYRHHPYGLLLRDGRQCRELKAGASARLTQVWSAEERILSKIGPFGIWNERLEAVLGIHFGLRSCNEHSTKIGEAGNRQPSG